MVEQLFALLVVSVLVEAVIHVLFSVEGVAELDKKIKWFPIQVVFSLVLAIAVCYQVKLDMFQLLFTNIQPSQLGYVCTGIIASRGSNYVHDIIKKINELSKSQTS